jgi:D-psicose/D-tagatose/L-ribulose 3-epimerase
MEGFGIHTSIWTMSWTPKDAEYAVVEAANHQFDFIEIALLKPEIVDATHSRALLEKHGLRAVCSLGLPEGHWPSNDVDAALAFIKPAIAKTAEIGAECLTGVIYGGIGERTGLPPTENEMSNVARYLDAAAAIAKQSGILLGIEPVNRYETHLLNTGLHAHQMIERVGADNLFAHLDTYHMNIEEKGAGRGILDCKTHLKYMHLSESDRGVPGAGTCDWNEIFSTLAAIKFRGGLAMESFMNMPEELAWGLSVWRPVAGSTEEVIDNGLPFLRNLAKQYGLI